MAQTGSSRTKGARQPARRTGWRRFFNYPRRGKGPIRRWVPSWRIVVGAFLGLFALGTGVAVAAYATTEVPGNLESINDQVTTIYYSDGVTPITTIQNETRVVVHLADLPEYVGNAVIASEDSSFRTNMGVDPRGLARALWTNLTTGARQGGSTLTQQFVERTKTDSETSYLGKIREMIIALKVNRQYTKDEILDGYLNTIYWGRNVNGIGAAAQSYFGKDAKDLTLSESALLAGIIPSPNNWDPDRNPDKAKQRWERVMDRMLDQGLITKAERAEAEFPEFKPRPEASNSLGGQTGYLVTMVEKEIGDLEQFSDGQLRTRGLSVVTTIDQNLQDTAEKVAQGAYTGDHPADPAKLAVGLVSMEPTTGELRAVYGGADFVTQPFNFATQGTAQAGSTFKPMTLLAALEDGHQLNERFDGNNKIAFPGTTWTKDAPLTNFGGERFGNIDLVKATANSVNTAYAALNIEIGPERTVEVAHKLGIPESRKIDAVPANVLGTASVSTLDLATAYSTLAGDGYRVTPHIVREVKDLNGNLVYSGDTDRTREFAPENIAAVTYAMTHVITEGSGTTALELARPVAGKTGTSNKNISSWFAAFVPQLVTVVGLHQQDPETNAEQTIDTFGQWYGSRNGMTGSTFAARAWTDFMKVALNGAPVVEFPPYTPPRSLVAPTPTPEETPTEEPTPEEEPTQDALADYVTVPSDLVGRQVNDAKKALTQLGLRVNMVAVDSTEPKSTVVSADHGGERVPPGSTITLQVSTGSKGNGNGNDGTGGGTNDGGTTGGTDGGTNDGTNDGANQGSDPTPTQTPQASPSPEPSGQPPAAAEATSGT